MIDRRALMLGVGCLVAMPSAAAAGAIGPLILRATNLHRKRHGAPALAENRRLATAADRFAAVLAQTGDLSHSAGGQTMTDRVRRSGYPYARLAENLGWLQRRQASDADIAHTFVRMWMESPGHRKNLLNPRLNEIGIGAARVGRNYYAVQIFGSRR